MRVGSSLVSHPQNSWKYWCELNLVVGPNIAIEMSMVFVLYSSDIPLIMYKNC